MSSQLQARVACSVVALLSLAAPARAQLVAAEQARDAWQRVPDIMAAMKIGPGSIVADIGAGNGFLTVRLAPVVGGTGKVYAVDSAEDALANLRRRVAVEHIENVAVIAGDAHSPQLPAMSLDAVVIVNAYHEFTFFDDMLAQIVNALRVGGRIVLVEPAPRKRGQTRSEEAADHVIDPELVVQDLARHGFVVTKRDDTFVRRTDSTGEYFQALVVAERPAER